MTGIIIILAVVACISNFFMDESRHYYDRFLGHVVPDSWDWWFNPAVSHANKYFSKNPVVPTGVDGLAALDSLRTLKGWDVSVDTV